MSYIDETWLRKAFQSLREVVDVDDHTRRKMIQFLMDEGFWDSTLKWETAEAKWNSCKNPNKSEFFKIGEIWALMLRFGRYQLFQAMADSFGAQIVWLPTEARRQAVLERLADSYDRFELDQAAARAELERLATAPIEPRAPGVVPGSRAQFSAAGNNAPRTAVERLGCP